MSTPASALGPQQICPVCKGQKTLGRPPQVQVCPLCAGTGVAPQPQPIRVPFDVVLPNAVLTALQQGIISQFQVDQDSDFEWIETVSTQTGIYSVTMKDPSTGRLLSNASVNSENFAGTAQLPHVLVEPYIWPRSSVIFATFNDRSNAGNTVQLVLRGYKLFPRNNPTQGSQGMIIQA